jgi:hypothetical protein
MRLINHNKLRECDFISNLVCKESAPEGCGFGEPPIGGHNYGLRT